MTVVTVYSRKNCHLCDVALETLESVEAELDFEIEKIFIDGNEELINKYGEEVPVIHIDGVHHDMFRVDLVRFRSSLEKHRQHQ
ncbi:MAG: glutaredoxin family protein [Actinobacteria bacterium]|nr:glutaredoxin family protein [Actinomycetota bacterium]